MKYFKDNKGDFYVELDNGIVAKIDNAASKDDFICVEEADVKPRRYRFRITKVFEDDFSHIMDTDWHVKDFLTVPCRDRNYDFIVEHIEDHGDSKTVYFVSKDIVGKSSMLEMEKFLDDFQSKMPAELVAIMNPIEHKSKSGFTMTRKINLLSYGNVCDDADHFGKDDMLFDGLKTEAERTKNLNGETEWYWTATIWNWERSPSLSGSAHFMGVSYTGGVGYYYASAVGGVVPSFSLNLKK